MEDKKYHFNEECLIVAYKDDAFAGIFLTYPDDTYTKGELLDFFQDTSPTYLIAANLPEMDDLTVNNYHSKLSGLIEDLCENDQSDLDIQYYIPRTLH